jgi:hypothetical protein
VRTWGQIRLELTKALPGVDIELLTGWIQSTYQGILESRPWGGLRLRTTIQCPVALGQDSTTVSCVQGSPAVVGVGTAWTSAITGWSFSAAGAPAVYIATCVDPTHLTLDRPFEGASVAGGSYLLAQLVHQLPADCKSVEQCENPYLWHPMERKTRDDLEDILSAGLFTGIPAYFAPDDDTIEDNPPVLHTVRMWPPPGLYPVGVGLTYQKAAIGFDGTNTTSYPLPWVSDDAIIFGAKGMALDHLKDYTGAVKADARAQFFISQMRANESEREGAQKLTMASRFTRHRLKRWCR